MASQLQRANESEISPSAESSATPVLDRDGLTRRIEQLGDWFHNLDLHGVPTAPNHFLGDFPNIKWKHIQSVIPEDLTGASVLDIGCNGGFYSLQLKRRGAERVLGIDVDDRYLSQARFAAEQLGLEIEFEKRSVYDVANITGQFDLRVLHGRVLSPALSVVRARQHHQEGCWEALIFQTMIRGSEDARA